MKYELLQSILPFLEVYEKTYPGQLNPQHFAVWLARHAAQEEQIKQPEHAPGETEDSIIGKYIVFMNRYAKQYTRKALEGTPLSGMDDFVYLITLLEAGEMTKSDLIQRSRHEKPTGMEVIRRLLADSFIQQKDDPADRRSKLLQITPAGIAMLRTVGERMRQVASIITGNLSQVEKLLLIQLLEKLEQYHQVVLAKTKGDDFEQVVLATGKG